MINIAMIEIRLRDTIFFKGTPFFVSVVGWILWSVSLYKKICQEMLENGTIAKKGQSIGLIGVLLNFKNIDDLT